MSEQLSAELIEKSRTEFEVWYRANIDDYIPHFDQGEYSFEDTQNCWLAWQGRQQTICVELAQRDELLATLIMLRGVLKTVPAMQHRIYDQLGIQVNNVIAKCESK